MASHVGNKDKIVKGGSKESGWSRGPTEREVLVNSPESESGLPAFEFRLFESCVTLGKVPNLSVLL